MKRFKAGILGTIVIVVLLGNMITVVVPTSKNVFNDVKIVEAPIYLTPIVSAFWSAFKYYFVGEGGTGTNPMTKPSSGTG